MPKITKIKGRQVFDSRGNPTVEAEIHLDNGIFASSIVPSGASTGTHEAFELRDGKDITNIPNYLGKSVGFAVENINSVISKALFDISVQDQEKIDRTLIELDNTKQKKKLGANAILPVSIAACKAAAISKKIPLYKHLLGIYDFIFDRYETENPEGGSTGDTLPIPLMNVINGGAHANNSLKIQEFMIRPDKPENFKEAMRVCFLVIQQLKSILNNKNHITMLGDEGGFAPSLSTNEEAIEFILKAIEKAGFKPGKDVSICLDIAANELYKDKKYSVNSSKFVSSEETIDYYLKLISKYPIKSIEDPFQEDDWESWISFNKNLKSKKHEDIQIVGDDIFATNKERLSKALGLYPAKIANTILIKPNQIGTLTETLEVIIQAEQYYYDVIISHRSGDSEDTFIADLAVATSSNQIKTGSLARSERVAKYNRLLRIEEELGKQAKMANI